MRLDDINVLLIEDEAVLAMIVKETLDKRGFLITLASNGVEGWSLFNQIKPDVCIVDVMMPRKDGFSLVADIRKIDPLVPIIFLTAKTQTEDILRGFELGADDYMKKPFSMEELVVRLKSLNRRRMMSNHINMSALSETLSVGSFEFNYQKLQLVRSGIKINLSQREAELLKVLIENKNSLLDRKTALLKIWGDDNPFNTRSMDVYITRLRKHLANDASIVLANVKGFGYKLTDHS